MQAPDLFPIPFSTLVDRLDRELRAGDELYGMRRKDWWTPAPGLDLRLDHLGHRLATPAGPASGPHTQLAQNLVLSWLGGGRFHELKTVQVMDDLQIPRPCIFAPHVGYNVEWSQELRVEQSAREYAKGWMLVHFLASELGPGLWPELGTCFDVSLGYDLAGVRSEKVRRYLEWMRDASGLLDELRAELSGPLARWREVPVPGQISDAITLSTFHGCPADEIEAIATQLLDWGWHTVVKLNPTLLGYETVRGLLDQMGYTEGQVHLAPGAFQKDLQWSQLLTMVPRLQARARERGLGFGLKLTNTLVCESPEPPFTVPEMYLSGPPLHVLAVTLAGRIRASFPDIPLTFSAGVEARNFASLVEGGLGPVTSCTDLLKGGGYARMTRYLRALEERMRALGVSDLAGLRARAGEAEDPTEGARRSLQRYAASVAQDPGYHRATQTAPRKVGTQLVLLDCLTCDKCVPVCPNAANFTFPVPMGTYEGGRARWSEGALSVEPGEPLIVGKRHQIGNVVDACNLCGQCDPWCPEDGGPYLSKPNLFLSRESWEAHPDRTGFLLSPDRRTLWWRRPEGLLAYTRSGERARLDTGAGELVLEGDRPVSASGAGELDLRLATTLRLFLDAFSRSDLPTWIPPHADAPRNEDAS